VSSGLPDVTGTVADGSLTVVHIINALGLGGSERLATAHVRASQRLMPGVRHRLVSLGAETQANAKYLQGLEQTPLFLNLPPDYRWPLAFARHVVAVRRLIRRERPALVHTYLWKSDLFTALATVGLDVRRVAHVLDRRGDRHSASLPARWKTRASGWLIRRNDTLFVAVSEAARAHAIEHYRVRPDHIVTAHNGIDPSTFAPAEERLTGETIRFGAISRFAAEKGHDVLLDAYAAFRAANPDCRARLTVAGEGASRAAFLADVEARGLAASVCIPGRVPSAAAFYRDIDVFILPSTDAEGLPTTILEAMASGLPVIATNVGGTCEAVADDVEGLIVAPRDPQAIADAMTRLVTDRDLARNLGVAARKRVASQFTSEAMTRKIIDKVYGRLLTRSLPASSREAA